MTILLVRPGDAAYLIPRTPGAPTAAFSTPAVTVVATPWPFVVVRLADGTEVCTHGDNVVRSLPTEPAPRHRPAAPADDDQDPLF